MATLMVGYDLNSPGQNYDNAIDALKATGTYWHYLDSTWLVVTNETPEQLRNRLQAYVDGNDEILVVDVSGRAAAWTGFPKDGSDWLMHHL